MNDFFQIGKWVSGSATSHDLKEIIENIKSRKCKKVFVGCDSHLRGPKYVFAMVIATYSNEQGGKFFFKRKKVADSRFKNSKVRLLEEVNYIVMLGNLLKDELGDDIEIHTHFDLNPNTAYLSSQLVPHAKSYAHAMGFIPTLKPDAWASSSIADMKAK